MPPHRPLPRVRRRGQGGRRAPRPPTPPEDFLREPFRLACQAVAGRARRRGRLRDHPPAPAHRRARAGAAHRADRPRRAGRRRHRPLRRRADRAAPRRRLRHRARPRHDDGRARARRSRGRAHARGRRAREPPALRRQRRHQSHQLRRGPRRRRAAHAVRKAINRELAALYERQGIDRREVYEVVVVGNATMRDLFFGLDVAAIGQRPYKSITEQAVLEGRSDSTVIVRPAHELGVRVHPRARIWGGPLIASHVGADVAADLLATGIDGTQPGDLDARRRRHEHRGRARGPRPDPRHELPGRAGVRGRHRDLRHAGLRGRDRVGAGARRRHLRASARSATRPRAGSAARA